MLKSLGLTNFKSFANEPQTIPFAPVTIFVGANGSGKSNVFDAIRFYQGQGMLLSFNEILEGKWQGGREIHPGLRGGAAEVCWHDTNWFTLSLSTELTDLEPSQLAFKLKAEQNVSVRQKSNQQVVLNHEFTIRLDGPPALEREQLVKQIDLESASQILDVRDGSHPAAFEVTADGVKWKVGKKYLDSTVLAQTQLLDSKFWPDQPTLLGKLMSTWADIRVLEMRPSEMRNYVNPGMPDIGTRGENLSAIVYQICQNENDKLRFVDWLSTLCAPEVRDITFDKTGLGDVLVQLVESNGEQKTISARSLSDGTLRFMGLLAALFTVPKGTTILLEEIENGLHPTRIHLLMELLEQFAAERSLQIIATTHSSQVLMGLSESALRDVILFARDEEHPGTIVKRLGDLDHFDEVTKSTKIDELFTTGWLEFAV